MRVDRVSKRFGALEVLRAIDLTVAVGERRALLGPNGAGKTTLFHIISGELAPTSGHVRLSGTDVTGLPAHLRARLGLARTFQRNNLFPGLTARENVRLAAQQARGLSGRALVRAGTFGAVNRAAEAALERVGLAGRGDAFARELSYGEQRQLEVAIALASEPKVMLLDEPTAGMSPAETATITRLLESIPREITLLVIEHDLDVVSALADRVTVLHHGEVLAEGDPESVRRDPRVAEVYLGGGEEA